MQVDSMDDGLRNGLWNALDLCYWERHKGTALSIDDELRVFLYRLWHNYFKVPIDTLRDLFSSNCQTIREYFFGCEWYEVYDFIEFVANAYPEERVNQEFTDFCNPLLERELSAYRFVGGRITQITAEEEIAEIEEALGVPLRPVQEHLRCSLDLLADRKNPDYRNSIKESILAVEACCQLITGNPKATLADALKEIGRKKKVDLHPALKGAFNSLYGYTSDAEGIRHALLDEPNLYFEDAKFMLVSCSAFINYLKAKLSRAGIEL